MNIGVGGGTWPGELRHIALCDRMGISYLDLMHEDFPERVLQDYVLVASEEARAHRHKENSSL